MSTKIKWLMVTSTLMLGIVGGVITNPKTATGPATYQEAIAEPKVADERAVKIDRYFESKKMPLAGYGMKFVAEADEHGIDWRLLPAISVMESTGGIHSCGQSNNPFGWGSCKNVSFENFEEAIAIVSEHLGGDNPRTARLYQDKTIKQILQTYNPPSISPNYAPTVMGIMEKFNQ